MKLDYIELENFRLYHGRQRLDFSRDTQRHVTLIHGINGAGKTSLFMAINWCLYGRSVLDNVGELISKRALEETAVGNLTHASVKLAFTHDAQRYVMQRTIGAVRQTDGRIETMDQEEVDLRRIAADGQAKKEPNPLSIINAILPANVRTYFLFDGEKIDQFAKPEAAAEVEQAIRLVLRLETLERAQKHLELTGRSYRRTLIDISEDDELKILGETIKQRETELEKTEARLEEVNESIELAKQQAADIDEQLLGMKEIQALQKERLRTEKLLTDQRKRLEGLIETIQMNATAAYLIFAKPVMSKALAVVDDKREKGQIPSNIRQRFVQDLLEELVCICGRPIAEHSPEYEKLTALLKESVPSSLEEKVLTANDTLRGLMVSSDAQASEIGRLMQERADVTGTIRQLEGEKQDLEMQLKDAPLEDAANLERKRKEYRHDIERLSIEKGGLEDKRKRLTAELKDLNKQIRQARKTSRRAKHLQKKMALAEKAAAAISETYQRFADQMRQQIEAETNEIFRSLIWKESHFQNITLSPDYKLEVIDRYGRPARPELSAGERQVLSLSFIAAMAKVSNEEAPLVMDTPFGRLSSHHRLNITKNLPPLASQLVLFITDEELRSEARDNIKEYIGAEYHLNFDNDTSTTTIREVG